MQKILKRVAVAVFTAVLVLPCHAIAPDADSPRAALAPGRGLPNLLASSSALSPASSVNVNSRGEVFLQTMPQLGETTGRIVGRSKHGESVVYTVDPQLHALAKKLVQQAHAPHLAVVALEPASGRILALAEKSISLDHPLLHAGFPAASLFKIVTASAALETNTIEPLTPVNYRGGIYALTRSNYSLDPKRDIHSMSLAEAMGKSCNPVFAHVALQHLVPSRLRIYAERFGFNSDLKFDIPLKESTAHIPGDNYEFSRTAAGFGDVTLSPIHAGALMAAVANRGLMPRPHIVDKVVANDGATRYQAQPQHLRRAVAPATAEKLMGMLEFTTMQGTSKSEFFPNKRAVLPGVRVAAKTGTLRGTNPIGLNRWFIAAAPIEKPRLVVAVLAINPTNGAARPAHIGRLLIQSYLNITPAKAAPAPVMKASYTHTKTAAKKSSFHRSRAVVVVHSKKKKR